MSNFIFKLFLTLSSTSLFAVIFFIKSRYLFNINSIASFYEYKNNYIAELLLLIYFVVPVILVICVLNIARYLSKDEFKEGDIIKIENAGESFMPIYLGYFFVALSISDNDFFVFSVVYFVVFIFVFISQSHYFNPILLLFGYYFYKVETQSGQIYTLISQRSFRYENIEDIKIDCVYRINDFSFIEIRKAKK